ncbi:unnamed protein product [Rhizophagus irregularis]|nr:unnamed protein product [Rhizophagus irregularis]
MKWPYKSSDGYKPTPETLSLAGFYFNPSKKSPDNVTCYLCHKSMDCWRPDDVPCEEHFTNSPDCVWAICQHIKKELDNNIPFNWDNEAQWPNSKNMCDIRFKTFKNWWPHDGKKGWAITSKKMAKAGFYFAPTYTSEDNVFCMYCGIELDCWEPDDDPVEEHRKRGGDTCIFFAKTPSKSKKSRGNKKDADVDNKNDVEVVDLTSRTKKNKKLNVRFEIDEKINESLNEPSNIISVNEEKINETPNNIGVSNERINESSNIISINEEVIDEEKINESLNNISISNERINESSNIISINEEIIDKPPMIISVNEEKINESPNNISISNERINESSNIISINEEVIDESLMIISMNVDDPLIITSVDENINEEIIFDEPMLINTNMDEPLNIISMDENEIDESLNIININEEVIPMIAGTNMDELLRIINMDVNESLTSIDENVNDEPSKNINITEENIDEPHNITDINEKRIDELPNIISINGIEERAEFIEKSEEIDEQIKKVDNNSTDEEGTRIVEQVNNAQTNEEEIIGLINNDQTKGDESVDKLRRTREEIKEKSMNFSVEEGINEKLSNISENEEHLMSQDLLNYVLTRVEEDERENVFINREEQSNVIDEEGRNDIITNEKGRNDIITNEEELNNIITNEGERNNIIENEEKLDIIVNKESNSTIMDENDRNMITDMEELCIIDKSERNVITDMEEFNIYEQNIITHMEELNIIDETITDEGDIIDGQVNNVKSIEEIYKMGDIITNEKTKGKLNNEEKFDEQLNELAENIETKENKKENLKTISPTIRYSPYNPVSSIFITPKRNAAFTVEDYLNNLKGTQNMRITEKTNKKIESLIKNVNKSIELILKIPLK